MQDLAESNPQGPGHAWAPFILAILLGLFAATANTGPVLAGQLNGHANAIPGFTGTTTFLDVSGPDQLSGTVDFAVFAPGDFPFGGYAPTTGELTYVYQIIMDAADTESLSNLSIVLDGDADNIGAFLLEVGDIPPSASSFSTFLPIATAGDFAAWDFEVPGLNANQLSYGLVFSSPQVPEYLFGTVVNGGLGALVAPLPTPSPVAVPEPGTATLLAIGALAVFGIRRRRLR